MFSLIINTTKMFSRTVPPGRNIKLLIMKVPSLVFAVCKHAAHVSVSVASDSSPPIPPRRLWYPGPRCVSEPLTRVMSHCVVEGRVA